MTLLQLKYVVAIDEEKSMRKAAEKLYVSQPRLSVALKELEHETGITIFKRGHNGVITTADGAAFIAHARKVLEECELLQKNYSSQDHKIRFSVSIQHYMFALEAYIRLLEDCSNDKYYFVIERTTTGEAVENVKEGKSEIGIISITDFNRSTLMGLLKQYKMEFHELFSGDTCVYLHPKHPLAKRTELSLKELEAYPYIVYRREDNISFSEQDELSDLRNCKKIIESSDPVTCADLMEECDGYMLEDDLPQETISEELVAIPLRGKGPVSIGYIVQSGSELSRLGHAYIYNLKECVDQFRH